MNDARLGSAESFAIASEDALGQAALVARGVHPPGSPVRAALERIAALGERIGALAHQTAEAAEEYPGASGTGRLGGIPTLIKDAPETAQRGLPLFLGSTALRDLGAVALVDSPLGARLRELGFVTLGVTKVPQLCFSTTTQPRGFTPVRNPWNLDHCAGGSSGGAAAAVAARLVPFASGTEDAGSIRIPASFCGVVGFKPSRGRVPLPEPHTYHRLHAFGLCRSIRDVACILDGVGTGSPRALFAREATGGFERRLTDGLPSLRIGLVTEAMSVEAHDDC